MIASEPQGHKKSHNIWKTYQKVSWECVNVDEMLLIVINYY